MVLDLHDIMFLNETLLNPQLIINLPQSSYMVEGHILDLVKKQNLHLVLFAIAL